MCACGTDCVSFVGSGRGGAGRPRGNSACVAPCWHETTSLRRLGQSGACGVFERGALQSAWQTRDNTAVQPAGGRGTRGSQTTGPRRSQPLSPPSTRTSTSPSAAGPALAVRTLRLLGCTGAGTVRTSLSVQGVSGTTGLLRCCGRWRVLRARMGLSAETGALAFRRSTGLTLGTRSFVVGTLRGVDLLSTGC